MKTERVGEFKGGTTEIIPSEGEELEDDQRPRDYVTTTKGVTYI